MDRIIAFGGEMEFSLPIRVRWDVDFKERSGRVKRIARKIAEASPLFVEVHISGKRGLSELSGILAELQKAAPRVSVHLGLFPGSGKVLRNGYPVEFVWDVGGTAGFLPKLPVGAATISFVPDADTLEELPDVLAEFADSGLAVLHLPNVNAVRSLAARGHVPVPGIGRLREAAGSIASMGISLGGKRLVVHDFFLWKTLSEAFPGSTGDRLEFSGCQAGTALACIDWEGSVYPCDSLPIRLGSLDESSLEEVWASPARERVVAAIRSTPGACDGCGEYRGCHGGCRGMAFLSSGTLDAPDPACPEEGRPVPSKRSSSMP
jgi:radical SAM protein with 4Fe4S-binding SPASM domain